MLLPPKHLCELCFKEASQRSQDVNEDMKSYIKKAVEEGLKAFLQVPCASGSKKEVAPELGAISLSSEIESDYVQEELEPYSFDFSLVSTFISAVKQAIDWEEEAPSTQEPKKYYPNLKKELPKFPFMAEIKGLMEDEWTRPDRKLSVQNRVMHHYNAS